MDVLIFFLLLLFLPLFSNGRTKGGFAFVFKVADASGAVYALKRILLVDRKASESAQREVDFLKNLPRHRAIVELIASEVNAKEALLLFEHCGYANLFLLLFFYW